MAANLHILIFVQTLLHNWHSLDVLIWSIRIILLNEMPYFNCSDLPYRIPYIFMIFNIWPWNVLDMTFVFPSDGTPVKHNPNPFQLQNLIMYRYFAIRDQTDVSNRCLIVVLLVN